MAFDKQAKETAIRSCFPAMMQCLVEPAVRRQQLEQQERCGQSTGQDAGGSNEPVDFEACHARDSILCLHCRVKQFVNHPVAIGQTSRHCGLQYGSRGRARTCNFPVNSRTLYH